MVDALAVESANSFSGRIRCVLGSIESRGVLLICQFGGRVYLRQCFPNYLHNRLLEALFQTKSLNRLKLNNQVIDRDSVLPSLIRFAEREKGILTVGSIKDQFPLPVHNDVHHDLGCGLDLLCSMS